MFNAPHWVGSVSAPPPPPPSPCLKLLGVGVRAGTDRACNGPDDRTGESWRGGVQQGPPEAVPAEDGHQKDFAARPKRMPQKGPTTRRERRKEKGSKGTRGGKGKPQSGQEPAGAGRCLSRQKGGVNPSGFVCSSWGLARRKTEKN